MADKKTLEWGLKDHEQVLASILRSADADALDQVLAKDYWFTGAKGESWGRERAIAEVSDPTFSVGHIAVRVDKVIAWSDVGVVVGRSEVQGRVGTQLLSGMFCFTHVWRRCEGRWQLVAGHASGAAESVESDGHPTRLPNKRLHPTGGGVT